MGISLAAFCLFYGYFLKGVCGKFLAPYNLIKQMMNAPLRESPAGFCDMVVFPRWKFFISGIFFCTTNTPLWFPPAMCPTLTTCSYLLLPGFSVTILTHFTAQATVLSRIFTARGAFYLPLLPHISAHL